MTESEIAAKKLAWEEHQKSKAERQAAPAPTASEDKSEKPAQVNPSAPKPVFRPKIKPPPPPAST